MKVSDIKFKTASSSRISKLMAGFQPEKPREEGPKLSPTDEKETQTISVKTPKKGVDYFTKEEISEFIKAATPPKNEINLTEEQMDYILKRATPKLGIHYYNGTQGERGERGSDGLNGKDGKNGRNGKDGKNGENGKDGKDAFFNEKESENKITDILQKELKKAGVNKEAIAKYGPWRLRHGGGDIIQLYDLSSQLDGVTKTFTIPKNRKITLVTSSSTPFFFRPTTDYTYTSTSITFTSSVDAASMLQAGQSLGVQYVN